MRATSSLFSSRVAAAAVLLTVLAPACADSGNKTEGSTSKAKYVEQADAICTATNAEFEELFNTDFPTIQSKTPEFFSKAAPLLEDRMSDLRALDVPEGDEAEIKAMLDAGEKAVTDFEKATQDEEFAVEVFSQEGGENEADFIKKASAYGIASCAEEEGEGEHEKVDTSAFSAEKKQYIEKADAICKAADEKGDPIEEEIFKTFPPTTEAWASGLPRLLEIERPAFEEFKKLTPPEADKPAIDSIQQKFTTVFASLEAAAPAAAAGDEERLDKELQVAFPLFDEIDAERKAFGFQVCGSEDDEG